MGIDSRVLFMLFMALMFFYVNWISIALFSHTEPQVSCAQTFATGNETDARLKSQKRIFVTRANVSEKFINLAGDLIDINQNIILLREILTEIWNDNPDLKDIQIVQSSESQNAFKPIISICLENEHSLVLPGGRDLDPLTPVGRVTSILRNDDYYRVRVFPQVRCKIGASDIVVQYSMPNYVHLDLSGLFSIDDMQSIIYIPSVPYDVNIEYHERDLTPFTTFFRPDEPRRKRFLDHMEQEGLKVDNINDWWGADSVLKVYDSRGILLNIRQTDHHHTLEEFRVLPALIRGVIVISEDVPLRTHVPYHNFVIWCKLEEFPKTIRNVTRHYREYFDAIFGGESEFVEVLNDMKIKAKDDMRTRVEVLAKSNGWITQNHLEVNSAAYLYTKKGHDHIPLNELRIERLAPLTKWVQAQIYKHQNPSDCANARFLITNGFVSGFGSEMHVITSQLAYAIQNNYVLMWGDASCRRFLNSSDCNRGCACLFKELSKCYSDDSFRVNLNKWERVDHSNWRMLIPDMFKDAIRSKIPSLTDDELRYWWRAQGVGFLMRLNDQTVEELSEMRKNSNLHYMSGNQNVPFPLPSGTINAHIRHGDKFKEMTLVPSEHYARAFASMISNMPNSFSRVLFVSSDDGDAIETCREMTENRNMVFIYSRLNRMKGGHSVSEWDRIQAGTQRNMILSHILQLTMALESDAYIGTRSSNWNRLIDELRCVWVDKCQFSFVEVGGPVADNLDW